MRIFESNSEGPAWLKEWPGLGYLDVPTNNPLMVMRRFNDSLALTGDEVRLFGDLLMKVFVDAEVEPSIYGDMGPMETAHIKEYACPPLDLEMELAGGVGFQLKTELQRANFIQSLRHYVYLQCRYKAGGMSRLVTRPNMNLQDLERQANQMRGPMLRFGFFYQDFTSGMVPNWPEIFDNAYMWEGGRYRSLYANSEEAFRLPNLMANLAKKRADMNPGKAHFPIGLSILRTARVEGPSEDEPA